MAKEKEIVFEGWEHTHARQGEEDWPPDTVGGTIAWWESKLLLVPTEYRSFAQIEHNYRDWYDGIPNHQIVIFYYRQRHD